MVSHLHSLDIINLINLINIPLFISGENEGKKDFFVVFNLFINFHAFALIHSYL